MDASQRVRPVGDRLGYLLKHARERLAVLSTGALAPFGITGRDLAVLAVLAQGDPPSQLEAAQRLSIDRTTMVGLLDGLEAKGLLERRADSADRRRNIVALTESGTRTLVDASAAAETAERAFLAPLSAADAERLRALLQAVVAAEDESRG